MRGFVGHRPDHHVGAVLIARNHVRQLRLGIGIGRGILPLDRPVDRNLRPHHQPHLLGRADHRLVVGIVRQPHEVAAHLLGPSQQDAALLLGESAAAHAVGRLLVDRHAAAEYLLPVEQNLRAPGLDRAETDAVVHRVGLGGDPHGIELRILGRPIGRLGLHLERRIAVGVGRDPFRDFQFGNLHRHRLLGLGAVELHPPSDHLRLALFQLHRVVADKGQRRLDDHDAARQPAVIPPVGIERRDALGQPLVVDLHHQRVLPLPHLVGDLEVEGRVAADVLADLAAVQSHDRLVVRGPEIEERASVGAGLVVEQIAVPDRTLVVVELGTLGVPVARDQQRAVGVEIVLEELRAVLVEIVVGKVGHSVFQRFAAIVVVAVLIRVDDRFPESVERHGFAVGDVDDLRCGSLLPRRRGQRRTASCQRQY